MAVTVNMVHSTSAGRLEHRATTSMTHWYNSSSSRISTVDPNLLAGQQYAVKHLVKDHGCISARLVVGFNSVSCLTRAGPLHTPGQQESALGHTEGRGMGQAFAAQPYQVSFAHGVIWCVQRPCMFHP